MKGRDERERGKKAFGPSSVRPVVTNRPRERKGTIYLAMTGRAREGNNGRIESRSFISWRPVDLLAIRRMDANDDGQSDD